MQINQQNVFKKPLLVTINNWGIMQIHYKNEWCKLRCSKAGVPLNDYKRIGGSAVGGSIGWILLRLFSTDRFDPTAQPSDQISHWQSKITSDRRTKVWHGRLPPITYDYYFPLTQVLPLLDFSSDFSTDPPILRSVGQWDAGLIWLKDVKNY